MKLLVIKIQKPDYGCEERSKDSAKFDKVILRGEGREEISVEVPEEVLDDKNINEGDWVYFDVHNEIHKE